MNRKERIEAILSQALLPSYLALTDDSEKHAGHAGAKPGGETHYSLVVEAPAFSGLAKVKRHQMIYALLAAEFEQGLHALAIDARAPDERI